MTDQISNNPKVLIEFDPEEISWLADRLHEMRGQWTAAEMMGAQLESSGQISEGSSEKLEKTREEIKEHKKMEARLRNRLIDKADDQGFGQL